MRRKPSLYVLSWMLPLFFGTCNFPSTCNSTPLPTSQQNSLLAQSIELTILDKTIEDIQTSYVDPSRVSAAKMFLGALKSLQYQIAELQFKPNDASTEVQILIGVTSKTFPIPVSFENNPETKKLGLYSSIVSVFEFMLPHLRSFSDPKEAKKEAKKLEYTAINGILSTLDPHSILLDPETYKDFKMSTSGRFGGVGIVIGLRKGKLTVVRPLKETPASRAGIKRGDHIVQIENQSTNNMHLTDAVNRLRGEPGTIVNIFIKHKGTEQISTIALKRENIQIRSITSHPLENQGKIIGYIRLSNFDQNTHRELIEAYRSLNEPKRIQGLILDLRFNPGGLLDQAIKVADEFLSSGIIVSTVELANQTKEDKLANVKTLVPADLPIVVLVNAQSASASEILAGALKKNNRALILGRRTFGKGSVQVLLDKPDNSALKLTIAQYLTPGNQSIQSVGITPDISLEPMIIKKNQVALFQTYREKREQDLDSHLTSDHIIPEKPDRSLRYFYQDPRERIQKDLSTSSVDADDEDDEATLFDDLADANEESSYHDEQINLATDLILAAGAPTREEMLHSAKSVAFFINKEKEEEDKTTEALKRLDIDWSKVGKQTQTPILSAEISTDKAKNVVQAGDTIQIQVKVKNVGKGPAGQVRAQIKAPDSFFDEKEFILGRIDPGKTKSWQLPVKIPKSRLSRLEFLKISFFEENGYAPPAQEFQIEIRELPRPRFAYRYQLIDEGPGSNEDGLLQKGESAHLRVTVKNTGDGISSKAVALLRNLNGDDVSVNQGRFELPALAPGKENGEIDFTFEVRSNFNEPQARFEIQVFDLNVQEGVTDKLTFPIMKDLSVSSDSQDFFVLSQRAEIRSTIHEKSSLLGYAPLGSRFQITKMFNEAGCVRVSLDKNRSGFISLSQGTIEAKTNLKPEAKVAWQWQVTPPLIRFTNPPLVTQKDVLPFDAIVKDEKQVQDVVIMVQNQAAKFEERKVFYRSNQSAENIKELPIHTQIPLWPGTNTIIVVGRQSDEVKTIQAFVVVYRPEKISTSPTTP